MVHAMSRPVRANPHRPRAVAWLALGVLVAVAIGGCLKIPLGDPEQSRVDPKLVGNWMKRDDGSGEITLLAAEAYDARTYLVMQYGAKPDAAGGWERTGMMMYKAWLTDVAGRTFVTMQVLGQGSDTPYMVVRLDLADDSFEGRGIKPGFVKDHNVQTPSDLRKLIESNIDSMEMYEDVQQYFRAEAADAETVKAIVGLFR